MKPDPNASQIDATLAGRLAALAGQPRAVPAQFTEAAATAWLQAFDEVAGAPETPEEDTAVFGFDTLRLPFTATQWVDADERMFQACFAILGQFVEGELGTEPSPWNDDDPEGMHRGYRLHSADDRDRAAIDLWLWFRDELPVLEQDFAADLNEVFGPPGGLQRGEPDENGLIPVRVVKTREPKYPFDHVAQVKDEKLRELIALRRALWT